jgi:hypothetical protein
LGDWGGGGFTDKTPSQESNSIQMDKMSSSFNSHFQIGLGDNFYCKTKIK